MKNLLLILVILTLFTSCSKDKTESENRPPEIWTSDIKDITYHSATLTWNGDDYDGDDIIWEIVLDGIQIHYGELNFDTGNFYNVYFYELEDLTPATEYSVDLIAMDGKGGETKLSFEFVTKYGPPKVETLDVSDINLYSALLKAKIIDSGVSDITQKGFLVHTYNNPGIENAQNNFPNVIDDGDEFYLFLSGMQNNFTYYVRAYAINSEGIGYGETKSFTALIESTHYGDVVLNSQEELNSFFIANNHRNIIDGSLTISGSINDLSLLNNLAIVTKGLLIEDTILTNFFGLENLRAISTSGYYEFIVRNNNYLINFQGINNLETSSNFVISDNNSLVNLEGLENLLDVNAGLFYINNNSSLESLTGLEKLEFIGADFRIGSNPQLMDISSLSNLGHIGLDLNIFDNQLLSNLDGLESLYSVDHVNIAWNSNLNDFCGIKSLLSDGYFEDFNVNDNLVNPTVEEIIANCD